MQKYDGPMKTLMSMIDANLKPIGGNKKTKDIDYCRRTRYESFRQQH